VSALLTYALVLLFMVVLVMSVASVGYMGRIYQRSRRPRSWFFRMMLNSSILKVICGTYVGYQTATLLLVPFGLTIPRIPTEFNVPILLIIAIILICPPVYYARTIYIVRKRGVYDPEVVLAKRTTESPPQAAEHEEVIVTESSESDQLKTPAEEDADLASVAENEDAPAESDGNARTTQRSTRVDKRTDVQGS
jgi:hypothetical protein